MRLSREQTFAVLREKSTVAGLTGLGVAIAMALGHEVAPGQEVVITELVLAIISVVAIATRPEKKHARDTRGPSPSGARNVGYYPRPTQQAEEKGCRDNSSEGAKGGGGCD